MTLHFNPVLVVWHITCPLILLAAGPRWVRARRSLVVRG